MGLLNETLQKQLRGIFAALPRPVTLLVFTRTSDGAACPACEDARVLAEEVASVSDGHVRAEVFDLDGHPEEAEVYGIDKAPAIVVLGGQSGRQDFGLRFYGAPAGYEFSTLVEDIRLASSGQAGLAPETVEALSQLSGPLRVQVFVTPTCPYCPRAVLLAHRMAIASHFVTAEAVDATEFPDLAARYQVYGVPRTVFNETVHIEGAMPEPLVMAQIAALLKAPAAV